MMMLVLLMVFDYQALWQLLIMADTIPFWLWPQLRYLSTTATPNMKGKQAASCEMTRK
jgi:hypothetical protein